MKITRSLLALLVVALAATACDTDPTGPADNPPPPVIGSGTGV